MERLSSSWCKDILEIQCFLFQETCDFFRGISYSYTLLPVTTGSVSSPMGKGSDSLPVQVNLLGEEVYLADSMQFNLEFALRLVDRPGTYYVSNSFRGEDPDSTHLTQFFHVECEVRGDMGKAMQVAEAYLWHLVEKIMTQPKMRQVVEKNAGGLHHVERLLSQLQDAGTFLKVTLDEARTVLELAKGHERLEVFVELVDNQAPQYGHKLTRKGEQKLLDHFGVEALWVTEMDHLSVPFYQAYDDPLKKKARCADLLMGLGETLGLGERHQHPEDVREALAHHDVAPEAYKWYADMREMCQLQTAGWGLGLERFMCWLLRHDDVRDMHVFPRLKGIPSLP